MVGFKTHSHLGFLLTRFKSFLSADSFVSQILTGIIWIARSGEPWRDLPERYGPWETVYSRFRKWIDDGILDNIFRILSLEAELEELSLDASIIQAHQHSAGAKKGGLPTKSDTAGEEPAAKSMQL